MPYASVPVGVCVCVCVCMCVCVMCVCFICVVCFCKDHYEDGEITIYQGWYIWVNILKA